MEHNIRLALSICFTSKWHSGSGEGNLLLDRLVRKDARNRPYIPGSTLKGVIRENCEKLSRTLKYPDPSDPHQTDLTIQDNFHPLHKLCSPVDRIFGNKYEGGCLFFRDARLREEPYYGFLKSQTRICKYRKLGTAKAQHLFSSEYAGPIKFETAIDGYHDDLACFEEAYPPYAYYILIAGIMMTDRIGGDKSTGSGNVEISFDALEYNGESLSLEDMFQYLDSELYTMTREECL